VLVANSANLAISWLGVHLVERCLGKGPILMFEIRTDSRNASLISALVTRPHHSNLYNRFERFRRFLRGGDVPIGCSLLRG